jgi:hypothetical protein
MRMRNRVQVKYLEAKRRQFAPSGRTGLAPHRAGTDSPLPPLRPGWGAQTQETGRFRLLEILPAPGRLQGPLRNSPCSRLARPPQHTLASRTSPSSASPSPGSLTPRPERPRLLCARRPRPAPVRRRRLARHGLGTVCSVLRATAGDASAKPGEDVQLGEERHAVINLTQWYATGNLAQL